MKSDYGFPPGCIFAIVAGVWGFLLAKVLPVYSLIWWFGFLGIPAVAFDLMLLEGILSSGRELTVKGALYFVNLPLPAFEAVLIGWYVIVKKGNVLNGLVAALICFIVWLSIMVWSSEDLGSEEKPYSKWDTWDG